jgi:hypothetical protein
MALLATAMAIALTLLVAETAPFASYFGSPLISSSRSDPDPDASARPRSKMVTSVDRAPPFLGAATPGTLRRSPVRGGRRTGSYDE